MLIRSQNVRMNHLDLTEVAYISEQINGEMQRSVVQPGDVLFNITGASIGRVAPFTLKGVRANVNQHVCIIRPKPHELDPKYLSYFISSPLFQAEIDRLQRGGTRQALTFGQIADFKIPFAPFPEQQRIADILDKADAIRRKRREAKSQSEDLPLSIFRESFKEYLKPTTATSVLAELAQVVSGVAKGRKFNGQSVREVPYLRVANVQAGYLDLSEIKTIPATEPEIAELRLQHGDVLLTEGGDHDKLGRGGLWEYDVKDCIHQNHVFRVRTNRKQLSPIYFVQFLQTEFAKGYFLRCAKKTTNLASINMRQLRALPVPVPPLDLQTAFEEEIATIRDLIEKQAQSELQANELFNSLIHRAFRGEL